MEYRQLGNTDINVSLICLGTMTWGEQNSEKDAHQQLNFALHHGVNFIDTAEMYAVPPRQETQGLTETYIGSWLHQRKKRDDIILATKVVGPSQRFPYIRNGEARLDKENIIKACNASLMRLKTDYIDLYQLHWPDRITNYFGELGYTHHPSDQAVPIEETLDALYELMDQGKIRHIGVSNETPWGLMEYIRIADQKKKQRIVSIQNPYSLLNRSFEIGNAEISIREKCGLLAYSPLAFGMLSGKYVNLSKPPKARLTLFPKMDRYTNERGKKATLSYVKIAQKYGYNPAQMALSYINSRPFLTSNIIGATNLDQLKSNIESVKVELNRDALREIEDVHISNPNPCP